MKEESGKASFAGTNWTLVLPIGALTLLGALMLTVSQEAAVALNLAEQHGESILLMREEIKILREEVKTSYTTNDAEKDFGYIREDIVELKQLIKEEHRGEK